MHMPLKTLGFSSKLTSVFSLWPKLISPPGLVLLNSNSHGLLKCPHRELVHLESVAEAVCLPLWFTAMKWNPSVFWQDSWSSIIWPQLPFAVYLSSPGQPKISSDTAPSLKEISINLTLKLSFHYWFSMLVIAKYLAN